MPGYNRFVVSVLLRSTARLDPAVATRLRDETLVGAALAPHVRDAGPLRVRRRPRRKADIVIVAPTITVDLIKDVITLRRHDPDLRTVALVGHYSIQDALASRWLGVERWTTPADLVSRLLPLEANVLVAATRGTPRLALIAGLVWSGRFVYRPYPFVHRSPSGTYPDLASMERAVLRRSDAVYHFFSDEAVEGLRAELRFTCPAETVWPGCVPELGPAHELARLSEADGEHHAAYVAGLRLRGDPPLSYLDAMPTKFRVLLEAGIHVHVFGRGARREDLHPSWAELTDDPRFHLEQPARFDELLERLTAFDWGLYHFDLEDFPIRPGFEHFASNGFFTYLQAGVPVITSPSMPTYADLVEHYDAGIAVSPDSWGTIPSVLQAADRETLRRGTMRAREELTPDYDRLRRAIFGA